MFVFGVPLFGLYGLTRPARSSPIAPVLRRLNLASACAAILLSLLGIALLAASFAGVPLSQLDASTLSVLVRGTSMGVAWQVRMGALFLFLLVALVRPQDGRGARVLLSTLGAIALASLAWNGHGAADEDILGWVHLIADIVHLLAAGVWIAALLLLTGLLFRPYGGWSDDYFRDCLTALSRFSIVGTVVVALLLLTGLANSWLLVGWSGLFTVGSDLYVQLLAAKLALFGLMLAIAALNRWRFVPALADGMTCGDPAVGVRGLRRSLLVEGGSGALILLLVGWLGTLAPPVSGG